MVVVLVLGGLVLLRFVLIGVGAALIIRPVVDCPACFHQSLKIRYRWLTLLGSWLEWRWCPHCGWQGPARKE
ncbi:MAG: hypothetical protein ACRERX_10060 [Pseudomonas sp.]